MCNCHFHILLLIWVLNPLTHILTFTYFSTSNHRLWTHTPSFPLYHFNDLSIHIVHLWAFFPALLLWFLFVFDSDSNSAVLHCLWIDPCRLIAYFACLFDLVCHNEFCTCVSTKQLVTAQCKCIALKRHHVIIINLILDIVCTRFLRQRKTNIFLPDLSTCW